MGEWVSQRVIESVVNSYRISSFASLFSILNESHSAPLLGNMQTRDHAPCEQIWSGSHVSTWNEDGVDSMKGATD